jgi:hypothetical protein
MIVVPTFALTSSAALLLILASGVHAHPELRDPRPHRQAVLLGNLDVVPHGVAADAQLPRNPLLRLAAEPSSQDLLHLQHRDLPKRHDDLRPRPSIGRAVGS